MRRVVDLGGRLVRPLCTLLISLAVWGIATKTGIVSPLFLPRIDSFARAVGELMVASNTYSAAFATTSRAMVGLLISIAIGVPLGLVFGRYPRIYEFVEFPVDFFRSVPSSALFFLFILLFGLGDISKIAVVIYGCSLIILVNTIYGVKPTREKRDRVNALRSFGANAWQVFTLAILQDALPSICAGTRVCVSLSLVLVIVTEMFLGATEGVGRLIYDDYLTYRVPEMYAAIVLLGFIGFGMNKLFVAIERRICFWLPIDEGGN